MLEGLQPVELFTRCGEAEFRARAAPCLVGLEPCLIRRGVLVGSSGCVCRI